MENKMDQEQPIFPPVDEFKFLNEEIGREQEYFWTRFSGLATLHAGLFVLFTSDAVKQRLLLSAAAVVLGFVWIYVQVASLWYVNRLKPRLKAVSSQIGFHWPKHCLYSRGFRSTTDVALVVPIGLTVLWIVLLTKNL